MNKINRITAIALLFCVPSILWAQGASKRDDYTFSLIAVLIVMVFILMLREIVNMRKRLDELSKQANNPSIPEPSVSREYATENLYNKTEPKTAELNSKQDVLTKDFLSFQKTVEQQLSQQIEMNFAQRDKLDALEDRLRVLIAEPTKNNSSIAAMSEQDLRSYIQAFINQNFKALGVELELNLIKKFNRASVHVDNMAEMEIGDVYYVDTAPYDKQLNQESFKDKWILGKSIYKIVIDHDNPNKAYLYLNSKDEKSTNNAWLDQPKFIAPFFDVIQDEDQPELPAILSKSQKLWQVVEMGKITRR